ncbi:hypothetical protein I7I51_07670 [Histoplasma capsulatum]|uniref:Uncharacterized protein n=1 Tax=Ajellomyces capsulatus TaxID=5037 RepID=A0A8A1M221_AJECA|nr:hypothetical protein I7I51_07670 [Histoplasma capsulatum]
MKHPDKPPAKKQENPTFVSSRLAFSTTLINYFVCSWEMLRVLGARQFPELMEREQRFVIGQTLKIHSMDKMDDLIGILFLRDQVNEIHDNICAGYSTEDVYNLCSTSYVTSILAGSGPPGKEINSVSQMV